MKAEIKLVCEQWLAATANGVYQGILLALVVAILLRLLVRTNAATRHAIWLMTLVLLIVVIPAHYWLDSRTQEQAALGPMVLSDLGTMTVITPQANAFSASPGASTVGEQGGGASLWPELLPPEIFAPAKTDTGDATSPGSSPDLIRGLQLELPRAGRLQLHGLQAGPPDSISTSSGWRGKLARVLHPVSWRLDSPTELPFVPTIAVLGGLFVLFRLVRLSGCLLQLRRLAEDSEPPGLELAALFRRLGDSGSGRRPVTLRVSNSQRCPLVLGFRRPVILLPAGLAEHADPAEIEYVLRHELAHVRRYDDWSNLFQHLAQAVFFFNPAVWWVSKELALQREVACDDCVLEHATGPRAYALALASVAARIKQPTPVLAPGASNNRSQLQQRINMILNTRRNASPGLAGARLASVLSIASLSALGVLCAGPRLALAQAPPAPGPVVVAKSPNGDTGALLAAPVAPAGPMVVAQADGPTPPTPAVEPGPKFKPETSDQEPQPGQVEAPEPPEAPAAPSMPRVARGRPGKAAPSPDSVGEDNDRNVSVEERLRRLEKMVKALMAQQNPKHSRDFSYSKDGAEQNWNIDQQALDKVKQSAERQAQRAVEQAQRAAEQAKKANRDLEARLDQGQDGKGQYREALEQQLDALRKAREGLGQEMERLDRQIQKLEKQQERGNKDPERRSESQGMKLQADAAANPELSR